MIFIIKGVIAVVVYVLVAFLLIKKVKSKSKNLCKMLLLVATLVLCFFLYSIFVSAVPYFSYLAKVG